MTKIYLDAGHGGKDSGAIGNGIMEKNVVLEIVKKMEKALTENYSDVEVMTTRTTDVFLELSERTDKANKWGADVFVSVHINSAPNTTAKGFETHIYTKTDSKTKAFQNVMHEEIYKQIGTGIQNRGKKASDFHVLRESHMTAILTENLFISNASDASHLKDDAFLEKLARGHVTGLEKFIGLKKSQQPPDPAPNGKLYRVQVGAFSDKGNADKLLKDLQAKG